MRCLIIKHIERIDLLVLGHRGVARGDVVAGLLEALEREVVGVVDVGVVEWVYDLAVHEIRFPLPLAEIDVVRQEGLQSFGGGFAYQTVYS